MRPDKDNRDADDSGDDAPPQLLVLLRLFLRLCLFSLRWVDDNGYGLLFHD
ncbi:hypothetical protein [uncultured Duncaniella sp.]|uniref:hypothetical protein n=1 Tax=uncultured Duncaniella sp. TaxID=2768039 RepID=UPI00262D52D2|nr:hypothetical protein [uncultured Duncaniella sp.]